MKMKFFAVTFLLALSFNASAHATWGGVSEVIDAHSWGGVAEIIKQFLNGHA